MLFRLWRECKAQDKYILDALAFLVWKVNQMTVTIDDVRAEIAAEKNVVTSAVTLLQYLQTKLSEVTSNTDLATLRDELRANIQPLADAVAQNTPASGDTSSAGSSGSGSTGSTPPSDATPGTPADPATPPASSSDAPPPPTGTTPSPTGS